MLNAEIDFSSYIGDVARRLLGEPNRALSTRTQWRYGSHGSMAVEVAGEHRGTWFDHERQVGGGVVDLIHRETGLADGAAVQWLKRELGIRLDGQPELAPQRRIVATYNYRNETGELLFQVVRYEPKDFRQRRPNGNSGWDWSTKGVRQVPYRLPELLERPEGCPVYISEGEKDTDRLARPSDWLRPATPAAPAKARTARESGHPSSTPTSGAPPSTSSPTATNPAARMPYK